jgi:hypothetical protein
LRDPSIPDRFSLRLFVLSLRPKSSNRKVREARLLSCFCIPSGEFMLMPGHVAGRRLSQLGKKHVGLQAGLDRGVELTSAQHASSDCSERKLSPAVFNSSMFDEV